ncbi:MAG TPA: glycosyltransferase family 87 protein [Chloroflexota bacterium]|nr:glycosyltransferase family 87 protein [Chloroflexota bacterium]
MAESSIADPHPLPYDVGVIDAQRAPLAALAPTGRRKGILSYALGNSCAILIGLISSYLALVLGRLASPSLLDLRNVDLVSYYTVGKMILAGHAGSIYTWSALARTQAPLGGHAYSVAGAIPFQYPPFFALFLPALALLPYYAAYLVAFAVNTLLLTVALFWLEQHASIGRRQGIALRWATFTCLPVFLALANGQSTMYLLALLTLSLAAMLSDRPVLAGAALGMAAIKPFYVLPLLLCFVIRGEWRAITSSIVSGAALLLLPIPVFGPSIYLSYAGLERQVSSWQGLPSNGLTTAGIPISPATYAPQWNHSLAGFTQLLTSGGTSWFVLYVAGSLVLLAACVWMARRSSTIDIPFAAAVATGLLISPHTLAYDLTLLVIPVAIVCRYRSHLPQVGAILGAVYISVTVGYRLAFLIPFQLSVLGSLALVAALILALWRRDRAGKIAPVPA